MYLEICITRRITSLFTHKDGRKYTLRMCEDCYDRLVNECVIPPRIDDVTEYA